MIGFVDVDIDEDGEETTCLVLSNFQIREYQDGTKVLIRKLSDEETEAILERMPDYNEKVLSDEPEPSKDEKLSN